LSKFLGESVDSTTLRRHRNPSFKFPWSPSCSTLYGASALPSCSEPPPFPRCHPGTPQPPTARPRSHYLDAPVLYVPFSRRARVSLLHIASFDRPTMIYSLYFIRFCLCLSFLYISFDLGSRLLRRDRRALKDYTGTVPQI